MEPTPQKRTIFYIDGFNLYHGAVEDTNLKWLDIERLCRALRPDEEIVSIRYFTSLVSGSGSAYRQQVFLSALTGSTVISTEFGRFTTKSVKCKVGPCEHKSLRKFDVRVEKRTDVNIGIHMVNDADHNRCDVLVLLSGDADLVPAVKMIRAQHPSKHVAVYVPIKPLDHDGKDRRSDELRKAANRGHFLSPKLLAECQFPETVKDRRGREVARPTEWR